jgi:hypothetical protein
MTFSRRTSKKLIYNALIFVLSVGVLVAFGALLVALTHSSSGEIAGELHPVPKTPSLVFYGTGGASWREGSLRESSSLRLCG